MIFYLNGQLTNPTTVINPLPRAVIISLFSWRRANPDDNAPVPMGWWGDTYPTVAGDRIGSRLWLLGREKITNDTLNRARDYATEALQWMLDDGVAARINITSARSGQDSAVLGVVIYQRGGTSWNMQFDDYWRMLNYG
ncbi:phage GP46 family protein [Citrobacter cronae]|uniref:phage GP46 family protein n=1 Tax=Citrobacter cronae TaxID=1748967 RepID=UPI0021D2D8E2|nr:phage GP46 family protein [Citrobacter cronae]MCU6199125.1 phage GP46 family protein [Citrobacter cronae]